MTDYIKDHNFGYETEKDDEKIHKLQLRNFNDLKAYVGDIVSTMLFGDVNGDVVNFKSGVKEQFFVKKI